MHNLHPPLDTLSLANAVDNITRDNPRLHIFLHSAATPPVTRRDADADADALLEGYSVAIKANIAVRGLPFSAGLGGYKARIAVDDAPVVAMLRSAGAAILGTVNMDEAALGALTNNPHFGRTENPHRAGFTPGGSSGGSAAAVAARFARVSLGTDTMGSCRIPAAYCGVVGYKPSFGRISVRGVEPLSRRLDHVGILAACVADIATVASVVCGFDAHDPWAVDFPVLGAPTPTLLNRCRFAVLDDDAIEGLQPVVARAYGQAIQTLRNADATIVARNFDQTALASARRAGLLLCEAALSLSLSTILADDPDGVSPHLRDMIAFAAGKNAPDLVRAWTTVDAAVLIERRLLDGVDAILWPTAPQTAFAFEDAVPTNQADFTCLANFSGAPALSLPLPVDAGELPVGLQIATRRGADEDVLGVALAIEKILRAK